MPPACKRGRAISRFPSRPLSHVLIAETMLGNVQAPFLVPIQGQTTLGLEDGKQTD